MFWYPQRLTAINFPLLAAAVLTAACSQASTSDYHIAFSAQFQAGAETARVTLDVQQRDGALKQLELVMPTDRFSAIESSETATRNGDRIEWSLAPSGGKIEFDYRIEQRRRNAYDARITPTWAILRLDDLFPRASARTRKGATGVLRQLV